MPREIWPDRPLPARAVFTRPVEGIQTDFGPALVFPSVEGSPRELFSMLPDEFYLRQLMELDLDSLERVATFADTYGCFLISESGSELGFSWVSAVTAVPSSPEEDFALSAKRRSLDLYRSAEAQGLPGLHGARTLGQPVTLDEFSILAWQLRDMTRVWQMLTGGIDLTQVIEMWESRHVRPPESPTEAASWLMWRLDEGLRDFPPYVVLDLGPGMSTTHPHMAPPLYSAVCLQLFNHIAERAVYRTCHNETCAKTFVRQIDRATGTRGPQSWTTDRVLYCTAECASMQAARVRRRKIGEANRLRRQGLTPDMIAVEMKASTDQVDRWLRAAAKRRKDGGGEAQ